MSAEAAQSLPADKPASAGPALSVLQRRRAQRLAVWNAAVWAVGNGLASTTLIVYLAYELKPTTVKRGKTHDGVGRVNEGRTRSRSSRA